MPKDVTITLDSGCFLQKKGTYCEIGYFHCKASQPDITVKVDGQPIQDPNLNKPGPGSVQIHHKDTGGATKTGGISIPVPFHDQLLHMFDLYGSDVEVENFDYILRFETGEFSVQGVRKRKFNSLKKLANGDLDTTPEETKEIKPIAHDILVRFTLADDESIEITQNGAPLWSSGRFKNKLEIKINADETTVEGFYRRSFKHEKDSYWLPNPDDPPPACPLPPCPDGG